jgi:molecular chaperone GrpE
MFEVPTDDMPSGMVVEVVQHGYVLHDRLLRPAMVGVSKAATAESAPPAENGKKDDKA